MGTYRQYCPIARASEIIAELASDARIRYVRQDVNIGMLSNFEYVQRECDGDLFRWRDLQQGSASVNPCRSGGSACSTSTAGWSASAERNQPAIHPWQRWRSRDSLNARRGRARQSRTAFRKTHLQQPALEQRFFPTQAQPVTAQRYPGLANVLAFTCGAAITTSCPVDETSGTRRVPPPEASGQAKGCMRLRQVQGLVGYERQAFPWSRRRQQPHHPNTSPVTKPRQSRVAAPGRSEAAPPANASRHANISSSARPEGNQSPTPGPWRRVYPARREAMQVGPRPSAGFA